MFEREALLSQLGDAYTKEVVKRFDRFAAISSNILQQLAAEALTENWGENNYVLRKYLAVHVPWSLEQEKFTQSANQFYTTAGHLHTRYGTPLYLVFAKNVAPTGAPWRIVAAGSQVSAPELPPAPDLPEPPSVRAGSEIVMLHDHILGENGDRVPFLKATPPVAQMCAVSGAIQWSLNRGLQLPYWYFGRMNYLVPLYLQSRENITLAPDLVAPIQVNPETLLVRTVLEPAMPFANARVAVRRHDQLPHWLLDGWNVFSSSATPTIVEDPEGSRAEAAAENP